MIKMEELIEKLREKDKPEAIEVYLEGVKKQVPPVDHDADILNEQLNNENCYVHKGEDGRIDGLIHFGRITRDYPKRMNIRFITALESKKGIGRKLIDRLTEEAKKEEICGIYSNVSLEDEGAQEFYKRMGFKRTGLIMHERDSSGIDIHTYLLLKEVKQ